MIKTKYLVTSQNFLDTIEIDELINDFLEDNPSIEIIDIMYQSNISAVADSGISASYFNNSALIVYKEHEKLVVPQCVVDWYEEHRDDIDFNIWNLLTEWDTQDRSLDFIQWFASESNPITTLIDMNHVGYIIGEKND